MPLPPADWFDEPTAAGAPLPGAPQAVWLALSGAAGQQAYATHYQRDAEYFDYQAEWTDDPGARHENRRLREWILRQLPDSAGLVLDVGCGAAWVAGALLPRGKTVVSMDISTVNPQRAVARYPSERHYAVVADVFDLPFREGLFDAIVAAEIIEHVPDPEAFLAALLRVLRPGGRLVVTTPYDEKIAYSLCIHCNQPTPHSAHLHTFTAHKLLGLLPAGAPLQARTEVAVHKLLLKLRTHHLLGWMPFGLWRAIDRLALALWRRPARLMLVVEKTGSRAK